MYNKNNISGCHIINLNKERMARRSSNNPDLHSAFIKSDNLRPPPEFVTDEWVRSFEEALLVAKRAIGNDADLSFVAVLTYLLDNEPMQINEIARGLTLETREIIYIVARMSKLEPLPVTEIYGDSERFVERNVALTERGQFLAKLINKKISSYVN